MKAEIIAIGTELLLGDILNSNAKFLSQELAMLGIDVYRQTVVGDNEKRIIEAFDSAFEKCDLVITTGGLGPTKDDLTKETAAKYLKKELILHEKSYKFIEEYFRKNGRELSESNKKQAYFPADAIVLDNICGTAPGAIMTGEGNKTIIVLPGPPREMVPMFKNGVEPYLQKFNENILVSKVLRIVGIGEGHMAEMIGDIIDQQTNPTVAPYAKEADVTLRLTAKAKSKEEADSLIKPVEDKIRQKLGDNIYGEGETTLANVIVNMLLDKQLTIGVAESCTGGLISSELVSCAGVSSVFLEGAITYSNEAKVRTLNVSKDTLERFGAVSEETAREMAEGIRLRAGTRIGIATTGIAGPDGGSEEKPVGLVYVGLSVDGNVKVKKFNFQGDRNKIRTRSTMNALDWLRREILSLA